LKLFDKRALDDCSRGLEILDREEEILKEMDKDDGNGTSRIKLRVKMLIRRGVCKVELMGNVEEGLKDYEKALELEPGNEELIRDVKMLKDIVV
jgi:hypothetical protein